MHGHVGADFIPHLLVDVSSSGLRPPRGQVRPRAPWAHSRSLHTERGSVLGDSQAVLPPGASGGHEELCLPSCLLEHGPQGDPLGPRTVPNFTPKFYMKKFDYVSDDLFCEEPRQNGLYSYPNTQSGRHFVPLNTCKSITKA